MRWGPRAKAGKVGAEGHESRLREDGNLALEALVLRALELLPGRAGEVPERADAPREARASRGGGFGSEISLRRKVVGGQRRATHGKWMLPLMPPVLVALS